MNIIELQNKVLAYEGEVEALMAEPSDENARKAQVVSGKLAEARDMLMAEAKRVQEENAQLRAAAVDGDPKASMTFIEKVLGPEASFQGIEPGWKVTVDTSYGPSALPTPSKYDTALPEAFVAPMGIIDTLPKGITDADEHYFQQPALTNNAAAWTGGTSEKAASSIEWPAAIAHLETIAHYIPIPKLAARRYRSLESSVSGALLLGLAAAKDAHVVSGNNASGIVGLTNQTGIQTYTFINGDNVYDAAVKMAAKVKVGSGFAANYVAMPSALYTELKTAKGSDGHYLWREMVADGKLDGMEIVIDENLAVASGGTTTNGMIVYFGAAGQFNSADQDELTIGLMDKQFIQNAYTLLAEGTYALKVPFPAAVCYCASAKYSGDTGSTN